VSRRYLTAKRQAEAAIDAMGIEAVHLRPGLVYGPGRAVPAAVVATLRGLASLPLVGRWGSSARALPVEVVARAAVRAALTPGLRGFLDPWMIEKMGAPAAAEAERDEHQREAEQAARRLAAQAAAA